MQDVLVEKRFDDAATRSAVLDTKLFALRCDFVLGCLDVSGPEPVQDGDDGSFFCAFAQALLFFEAGIAFCTAGTGIVQLESVNSKETRNLWFGILVVMSTCTTSGLAAAYTERAFKAAESL